MIPDIYKFIILVHQLSDNLAAVSFIYMYVLSSSKKCHLPSLFATPNTDSVLFLVFNQYDVRNVRSQK